MTDEEELPPIEIPHRTPEEIHELAVRAIKREIIVTNHPDAVQNAFGFILAMIGPRLTEEVALQTGALIGEYSNASDRSFNGWPVFWGVAFLHIDDRDAYMAEYERLEEAMR